MGEAKRRAEQGGKKQASVPNLKVPRGCNVTVFDTEICKLLEILSANNANIIRPDGDPVFYRHERRKVAVLDFRPFYVACPIAPSGRLQRPIQVQVYGKPVATLESVDWCGYGKRRAFAYDEEGEEYFTRASNRDAVPNMPEWALKLLSIAYDLDKAFPGSWGAETAPIAPPSIVDWRARNADGFAGKAAVCWSGISPVESHIGPPVTCSVAAAAKKITSVLKFLTGKPAEMKATLSVEGWSYNVLLRPLWEIPEAAHYITEVWSSVLSFPEATLRMDRDSIELIARCRQA